MGRWGTGESAGRLRQAKEVFWKTTWCINKTSFTQNPWVLKIGPPRGFLETLGTVPKEYSHSRPRSWVWLRGHPTVSSFDFVMLSAVLNSCLTRASEGRGKMVPLPLIHSLVGERPGSWSRLKCNSEILVKLQQLERDAASGQLSVTYWPLAPP